MSNLLAKLSASDAVLLVIDVQERLLPAMHQPEECLRTVRKLIESARVLKVPFVVTEQYPTGLGRTCTAVWQSLSDVTPVEKMNFSACVAATMDRLRQLGRKQVLVAGIETHVCVQQTVLDLLREGYQPWVCADAVSSRRTYDRDIALSRMQQAGAIVTTAESAVFELLGAAGTEPFKQILKIIK